MAAALRSIWTRFGSGARWIYEKALKRAVGNSEFREIVAEFFLEAGVLCFVFPVLDTIVQFGVKGVTLKMAIVSTLIAVGCLYLAGLFHPQKAAKKE